ncbi:DUF2777 family protein [Natribacillus halophilus]|uniref:DUF2777 domain-containing protein n=1 Tax=Natribacillus halophilus TaxID=549003 RepID=A0A1G8J8J9_9BACI|nr:DUF2777 family protein [Natribacillus halophilus]SDI27584.1 Protein of unknown function [Natribacillus halophilus]
MNRKEAIENKGHTVLVDSHPDCVCYGVLTDIDTPENKIWQGTVKINGIHTVNTARIASHPPYQEGEEVTVSGTKIRPFTGKTTHSYRASLLNAIQVLEKETNGSIKELEEEKQQLQELRVDLGNKRGKAEDPFLYFHLTEEYKEIILQEQSYDEKMSLEGCPFEMDWFDTKANRWTKVMHENQWVFKTATGKRIRLQPKDTIRIHKEQFEPFQILLNELESPSKQSLARLMHYYGFQRKHMVQCHNTLLRQLLEAEEDRQFSGVNFIICQKNESFLMIQHRYERKLHSDRDDYVYDRFECTSDLNERQVITYTNMQTSQ